MLKHLSKGLLLQKNMYPRNYFKTKSVLGSKLLLPNLNLNFLNMSDFEEKITTVPPPPPLLEPELNNDLV